VAQVLTGAGAKYAGLGLIGYSLYRLIAFTCEFLAGRHDARQKRLLEIELRVDSSIADRLKHLERLERTNRRAIVTLEGLVRVLATELHRIQPDNPKLADVAKVLSQVWDITPDTPDDMSDTLDRMP
jgi:hypothetical protein